MRIPVDVRTRSLVTGSQRLMTHLLSTGAFPLSVGPGADRHLTRGAKDETENGKTSRFRARARELMRCHVRH